MREEGERSMQMSITCACSRKEKKNGTKDDSLSPASRMTSSYHSSS